MVRRDQMVIHNLEGVLYRRRLPLLYFCIKDRKLVSYRTYGWEMKVTPGDFTGHGWFKSLGVSEWSINEYYRGRVVQDGAMMVRDYLDALGLVHYDFEAIIKASCGWNPADREWLKFDGGRFQSYEQILSELGLPDDLVEGVL